jgi:hypothetical protein
MPRPWRVKALRSDGQVVLSSAAAALTPAQLLGQGVGAFGLGPVGEEAAGLPAQGWRSCPRPYSSALIYEWVLSEADVEQYAATARMRLRLAA